METANRLFLKNSQIPSNCRMCGLFLLSAKRLSCSHWFCGFCCCDTLCNMQNCIVCDMPIGNRIFLNFDKLDKKISSSLLLAYNSLYLRYLNSQKKSKIFRIEFVLEFQELKIQENLKFGFQILTTIHEQPWKQKDLLQQIQINLVRQTNKNQTSYHEQFLKSPWQKFQLHLTENDNLDFEVSLSFKSYFKKPLTFSFSLLNAKQNIRLQQHINVKGYQSQYYEGQLFDSTFDFPIFKIQEWEHQIIQQPKPLIQKSSFIKKLTGSYSPQMAFMDVNRNQSHYSEQSEIKESQSPKVHINSGMKLTAVTGLRACFQSSGNSSPFYVGDDSLSSSRLYLGIDQNQLDIIKEQIVDCWDNFD